MLPTNIPTVRANELRLDNLFELADGTVAVVDYESVYRKSDKVKYLNYGSDIIGLNQKEPNSKGDAEFSPVLILS